MRSSNSQTLKGTTTLLQPTPTQSTGSKSMSKSGDLVLMLMGVVLVGEVRCVAVGQATMVVQEAKAEVTIQRTGLEVALYLVEEEEI